MTDADMEPDPWVEPTHPPVLELIVNEPEPETEQAPAEDEALAEVVDLSHYFKWHDFGARDGKSTGYEYLHSRTKRMQDVTIATAVASVIGSVWLPLRDISQQYCDEGGFYLETQTRTGFNEQAFELSKFRTLFESLVSTFPNGISLKNDDRTNGVGNFLRNFGPDEIPQLINVLNGTMSLIGPRPILPMDIELMVDRAHDKAFAIYWQEVRALALPGILGPGQMLAHQKRFNYDPCGRDQQMLADVNYVEKASLKMDMGLWAQMPGQVGSLALKSLLRNKS